jgi:hypothetical protein
MEAIIESSTRRKIKNRTVSLKKENSACQERFLRESRNWCGESERTWDLESIAVLEPDPASYVL